MSWNNSQLKVFLVSIEIGDNTKKFFFFSKKNLEKFEIEKVQDFGTIKIEHFFVGNN